LTQTLALALSPHIRVNAIGPGPTLKNVRQTEADFQAQYEAIPLKKPTDLMDISNAVLYILSAQAMTGQMITLDGGEHLGWAQGDNHTPPRE
jgi:NAD(P)-dependent dehydrogenase (short-subunit alcohol dehydrogenase family)